MCCTRWRLYKNCSDYQNLQIIFKLKASKIKARRSAYQTSARNHYIFY